jgi:hypothetical protein
MTVRYKLNRHEEAPRTVQTGATHIGPVVQCPHCGEEMQLTYRHGNGPPPEVLKPRIRQLFLRALLLGAAGGLTFGLVLALILYVSRP